MRHAVALLLLLLFGSASPPAAAEETDADAPSIVLEDVTAAAGLAGVNGDRFSFADYDGDGDPDLLVNGRTLLRNETKGYGTDEPEIRFEDVTEASGTSDGAGGGACWADFDGDGDLDVVTTGGALKIQDPPGTFRNAAEARGLVLEERMATVGVGDADGDGRPDVLFGGGEDWNDGNPRYFRRRLFRNVGGARFEDVTEAHGIAGALYGRAVVWADYDRDGDQDVYVGNYRLKPNELFVSEGGRLEDRAPVAGVAGRLSHDRGVVPSTGQAVGYMYGHTIAASWSDLDADGDLDLWVSNLVHKYAGPSAQFPGGFDYRGWICDDSALYRNDGPPGWGFTDLRGESGIPLMPTGDRGVFRGDELWSHAACADLDGDGLPEVFVTQVYQLPYSHALLFRNRGGFRFEEVSEAVGLRRFDSYGGAFADVDGDGDADLVCNGRPSPEGPREVRLYRNDTAPGPWIAFRLRGEGGDPLPLGAQVLLRTDGGAVVRQVESAMGSHAQQNEGVLRFGLRGREVEEVWVRWPGGVLQRVDRPRPGRVNDVAYPSRRVPEIDLLDPVPLDDGGLRLRARGSRSGGWAWRFDLDGDGVFEESSRDGTARVPAPAGRIEVRVRLLHPRRGLARVGVWRLGTARSPEEE